MIERRPTPADLEPFAELVAALDTSVLGFTEFDARRCAAGLEAARSRPRRLGDRGRRPARRRSSSLDRDGSSCADGYVHPDFHGRGIGTRLVELSEQVARERGRRCS